MRKLLGVFVLSLVFSAVGKAEMEADFGVVMDAYGNSIWTARAGARAKIPLPATWGLTPQGVYALIPTQVSKFMIRMAPNSVNKCAVGINPGQTGILSSSPVLGATRHLGTKASEVKPGWVLYMFSVNNSVPAPVQELWPYIEKKAGLAPVCQFEALYTNLPQVYYGPEATALRTLKNEADLELKEPAVGAAPVAAAPAPIADENDKSKAITVDHLDEKLDLKSH